MKIITGKSFSYVYKHMLDCLLNDYDYVSSSKTKETREILDFIVTIEDPTSNLFSCTAREFPLKYLAGELVWYFTGRNDAEFISRYSKFWNKLSDDHGNLNSAYGYLLFKKPISQLNQNNQWSWALNSLMNDKETRQAIIRFNDNDHQYPGNKDFVCTLIGHFFIRNDKLHMTTHMRSSDIIRGITFDWPFFSLLQQQMKSHLKNIYPNIQLGYNRLILGSSHIYSEHYELAENMLDSGIFEMALPTLEEDLINHKGNASFALKEIERKILCPNYDMLIESQAQAQDKLHNWICQNVF